MEEKILTDKFVEDELHWWNVPGVTLGICQDGRALQVEGFGFRDIAEKLPMTGETLGGIASCSKSFCSAVIASLVDEGVLDFDRPVHDYLPELSFYDETATKECTLRDMLYHRTGIAGHDAMWPDDTITRKEYLRRIRFLEPNEPFRYKAQYSNTIYNLIGIVAEEVTGKKFEDLVQERILMPLGMTHTVLSVAAMRGTSNWAKGYLERTPVPESEKSSQQWLTGLTEMPAWEMNVGVPAAGVNSCPADMLKWLTLHLQNGQFEGKQLFSSHVMDELHTPAVVMSAFPWRFPEVPGIGEYGMAWKTTIYRGLTLRYHCGEIEGYSSIECFLPGQNFGMFALCNHHAPVTPFLMELVYTAIDRALGLPAIDWACRLHPYQDDNTGSCEGWKLDLCGGAASESAKADPSETAAATAENPAQDSPDTTADDTTSANPAGFRHSEAASPCGSASDQPAAFRHSVSECVGSYRSDAYGVYRICEKDSRLLLAYKTWLLPLEHLTENLFRVPELKEDTLFIDMPLQFTEDAAHKITGFTLRLERTVSPVFFQKLS